MELGGHLKEIPDSLWDVCVCVCVCQRVRGEGDGEREVPVRECDIYSDCLFNSFSKDSNHREVFLKLKVCTEINPNNINKKIRSRT